ncbi:MAG: SGNH/GDSL hydrolase family protein [Lentisphaerae bacterium]|nr:SGNH/GDSL hydrolase family protein [Lentisphaerota bacterium]MBT4816522.1 SGNH/GDSL hydrolase family protein [Lentisphaerota bacterium]MBT5605040.1 SGNH/GDSL hydrolase family protein [Lentisphaerota bacterium]MBT7058662.1 SGNH/GDSL hydrolase family protein [Lentisphaerota bacterium]MBT7847003.1 SGNH/GDSL hydrolase family protein [Lentisphaerota bacterium]
MGTRVARAMTAILLIALSGLAAEAKTEKPVEPKLFAGDIKLQLPPIVYAVPGVEMNIYFDNIVLMVNPRNVVFDVTCQRGTQQNERWTFTPTEKDVGVHPLRIEVLDQTNAAIARADTTVRVSPANAGVGRPIRALVIGDSLTNASAYTQQLVDLCAKEDNPLLTLIGTRGRGEKNRHEGYGGWTAERFATHYTGIARGGAYKKCGSPFIYKDGEEDPKLDLPRYCKEFNEGKPFDVVTMLLGCNDTFSSTDETIEERIDRMFTHYETLVKMVREHNEDALIGALLLVPPAATQDAFGTNYRCSQTRWQYKRNQHRVVERMMAQFGGREGDNLFLLASYTNLDCVHNYPKRTAPWNSSTTAKGTRLSNGVHPATEGYKQIGDTIYCWLKAMLADK